MISLTNFTWDQEGGEIKRWPQRSKWILKPQAKQRKSCSSTITYNTDLLSTAWTKGILIPCGLLLQSGYTGHIEHYPEEKQRLIGKFVQLLLQRFFQFHPSCLLALAEKPKAKVVCLDKVKQCQYMVWASLPRPHIQLKTNATMSKWHCVNFSTPYAKPELKVVVFLCFSGLTWRC